MTRPSHTGAVDTIRVLHIDDEREPLRMTKKLLEMADERLKVESVSSPVEALEMLREGGFDCVVTDFKMSPMDGIEVARSIRESSDIPIILYTGHGSEDVAVKAFAVGIDDYVRKELHPLHFEVLANRVRGVVERRWAEKLYGDILDGSRDGVLLLEGTNFIYANQAMADLLGVSDPRELIGRDSLDWIHKSDRERVKRYSLGRQRGEDMPSVYEYNVETSDGRERVFETSASLINFRGRKGSLEFTRDITERRQIRDELKSSDQRWRSLVELAPDGIVTLDLMGRVTSINAAFTKLTGFNKDEIVGKHFTKVGTITTKDMGRYVKLFASFVRGKALPVIEFDYRRKDGSLGKGESVAQIVELEEGKKEVLAILRDVSDRSRMEEDLRESEERHRSLFDDSPVSLWEEDFSGVKKRLDDLRESGVIDLRTYLEQNPDEVLDIRSHVKITAVNKATLDLYGAKDLEELRRGFASMFTEESHAFFREELVALSEGKTMVEGESTTVTLRGDRRHVDLRLVVPHGYEGSLEKVIMSVVDITEMKQLEEERQEHSQELEMKVEQRTRELLDAERMAAAGSIAAMV
nr:PAS domain S-box protein [Candidatus Bathyarchaeota archaeon]